MQTLSNLNSIYATSLSEPTILKLNSSRLLCGDRSGNINVWRVLKHGQRIRFDGLLVGHILPITDLKMDEGRLISIAQNELRIWSLVNKSCLVVYSLLASPIIAHLDSTGIAVGTGDGQALFLNRNGRKALECHPCSLPDHRQGIQFIQILDELLVMVTVNGNLWAQRREDGGLVWSLKMSQRIVSMDVIRVPLLRVIRLNFADHSFVKVDVSTGSPIPQREVLKDSKGLTVHQGALVLEAY